VSKKSAEQLNSVRHTGHQHLGCFEKISSRLARGVRRVTESDGWKEYEEIIPPQMTLIDYKELFAPHDRGQVVEIGEVLRHLFVSRLPGRTEKEKLNSIFRTAPPWLIWFTFADYTAAVLDLNGQSANRTH
jgi:hypothetical protein